MLRLDVTGLNITRVEKNCTAVPDRDELKSERITEVNMYGMLGTNKRYELNERMKIWVDR